jgi:hypothetical protein
MTIKHLNYTIEINNEPDYTFNSADNIIHYDIEYADKEISADEVYPTSKHGIRISKNGEELKSAIVCEVGGSTTIHDKSFIIEDDYILLCCCNKVYSLKLPDLTIHWKKELDWATCFAIYPFMNDFVVHGELEITRVDKNGNVKWIFGARDIFVTPDEKESIEFTADNIKLRDWQGYEYLLNENGQEIK